VLCSALLVRGVLVCARSAATPRRVRCVLLCVGVRLVAHDRPSGVYVLCVGRRRVPGDAGEREFAGLGAVCNRAGRVWVPWGISQ